MRRLCNPWMPRLPGCWVIPFNMAMNVCTVGPCGAMIRDQIGSPVVIQVPCFYATSQSDLLICPHYKLPKLTKRPDQHFTVWLTEVSRSEMLVLTGERSLCDVSRLRFVDEHVMCKWVNNLSRLRRGICLFIPSLPHAAMSTANSSACCPVYVAMLEGRKETFLSMQIRKVLKCKHPRSTKWSRIY